MKARLILYVLASAILFACHAPVRVFSNLLCRIRTLLAPESSKSYPAK